MKKVLKQKEFKALIASESAILKKSIQSFLEEALNETSNAKVLDMYKRYDNEWFDRAKRVNDVHGCLISAPKAFEHYLKTEGYKNVMTKPFPMIAKSELLRIIKVIEQKSEFKWLARNAAYKFLFLIARVLVKVKSIWKTASDVGKGAPTIDGQPHEAKMNVVK